ncbi:MAG: hypothetical protein GX362_00540 [Methanosarcinaceae archaeon]|nr:hypothetical protein [Methanosarcinaceae archaeon]
MAEKEKNEIENESFDEKSDEKKLPNELLSKMISLRQDVYEEGMAFYKKRVEDIEIKEFENSAKNLSFYLALRRRDLREIQSELSVWGLSSLGRLESRTMSTIDSVISSLGKITNTDVSPIEYPPKKSFTAGRRQLEKNAELLFGKRPENRNTSIMVTMPQEAAKDYKFVADLMKNGMNVARINCAHDDTEVWEKIIKNIRKAEKELDRTCKVLMDISGPKARISWVFSSTSNDKIKPKDYILITGREKIKANSQSVANTIIGCSLPEILNELEVGDPVLIDDGVLEAEIKEIDENGVLIRVNKTQQPNGIRLRVDKGLNFPHSDIKMDIVTEKDKKDLDFICEHADIAGCSFVKNAKDIKLFLKEIHERKKGESDAIPILIKVETILGIRNLSEIIMVSAGKHPVGVMIARGDLAVESGYLRLAELQQEILWICEAADVPVVWATQVLENMVKTGIPTRAEVTDVSEGAARAECVMLNKGEYITDAVCFLDSLLEKMKSNQYKKTSKLRALNIAKDIDADHC